MFHYPQILISRRPADITQPCQLGKIEQPILIRWIMPQEVGGDIVNGGLRSADAFPLCVGG